MGYRLFSFRCIDCTFTCCLSFLYIPRPDLPTNLRSLKRATWFLKVVVALRSSADTFSSLPAVRTTLVPSGTSLSESTLKGSGRVLLQRQWDGRMVHTKFGLFVLTSSPGYSAKTSEKVRSPLKRFAGGACVSDAAPGEAIRRMKREGCWRWGRRRREGVCKLQWKSSLLVWLRSTAFSSKPQQLHANYYNWVGVRVWDVCGEESR